MSTMRRPKEGESRWQDRTRKCRVPVCRHPTKSTPARECESMSPRLSTATDPDDPRCKRKRSIPATVQGLAYPERVAYLRETFVRLPWTEAYSGRRGQDWPEDRYGGVSEAVIAEARSVPGNDYEVLLLELKREYCLVRWRTWLDSKFGNTGRRCGSLSEIVKRRAKRALNAAAGGAESRLSAAGVAQREERLQAATAPLCRRFRSKARFASARGATEADGAPWPRDVFWQLSPSNRPSPGR